VLRGKGWVVDSRFKRGVAPKKKFLDSISFKLSDCLIGLADHVLNHVQKIRLESNRIEHPPLFESNRTLISLIRFDRIIIGQIRFDSIRSELYRRAKWKRTMTEAGIETINIVEALFKNNGYGCRDEIMKDGGWARVIKVLHR